MNPGSVRGVRARSDGGANVRMLNGIQLALKRIDNQWLISAWTWTEGGGGGFGDVAKPA